MCSTSSWLPASIMKAIGHSCCLRELVDGILPSPDVSIVIPGWELTDPE
ncbi:hypothetical protein AZ19_0530 [Bordetella bronchiseptica E012]|uniref:Uncharacterized protein n=1 Tax=Bordetella bronchiseptica 00-P-2796 TaxID=1331199 RepID=A0ABR4R8S2_BORBO|nr:hypothetical protein L490_0283 [Bordetella bronchiseptica 00-P-2796]KDB58947.1 hypothetical protein AZ16_0529 [Bordetella bronchiseptica B18-5 (C3)]KDC08341.1 hypothetical protein AZ19_0530 [Bordetella bronchiseptica E012]KDD64972.1 hypothetical protein L536_0520 [Bordetella bronchiseptica SO10328]KDD88565.1 hypothetical protein L524_0356 [Bordetella bronchiseptica MBORD762]